MTTDRSQRAALLKTRNLRRLQRPLVEEPLRELGFNPILVGDGRAERLLVGLKSGFCSERLADEVDWPQRVGRFARGRFGLTIARLWDWDGGMPMFRVAAASIAHDPQLLAQVYPSGFVLVDDDDRRTLVVDLEFDEDEQKLIGRIDELELDHAPN
jgi:hypothetical protein